jgi:hypothetical protein
MAADSSSVRLFTSVVSAEVRELEGCPEVSGAGLPGIVDIFGAGSDTAGPLALAAGDNRERLHSEAAFAQALRRCSRGLPER